MNKELFLAILKNDIQKVMELLAQQKAQSFETVQQYVNAPYQTDYQLTKEIIAEIDKILPERLPISDLGLKAKLRLKQAFEQEKICQVIKGSPDKSSIEKLSLSSVNITPLMLSVLLGRSTIMEYLIENSAEPNGHLTALGWNTAYCACQNATMTRNMLALGYLKEKGMNLEQHLFDYEFTQTNPIRRDYKTVLLLAIHDLNVALVRALLHFGASANGYSALECTPLMAVFLSPIARKISDIDSLKYITLPKLEPEESLAEAAETLAGDRGDSKEHKEKREFNTQENQDKIATIVTLLVRHHAKIGAVVNHCVHHCKTENYEGLSELSLRLSHFPKARRVLMATHQLHKIAYGRVIASIESIEKLLEAGASLTQRNKEGNTPLHTACIYPNLDAIKQFSALIHKHGLDTRIWQRQNSNWKTPRDLLPVEHHPMLDVSYTCDRLPHVPDREIFVAILKNDGKALEEILTTAPDLANQRYQAFFNLEQDIAAEINKLNAVDEEALRMKKEIVEKFETADSEVLNDPGTYSRRSPHYEKYITSTVNITPIMLAILLGKKDLLDILLKHNAHLRTEYCYHAWTPLFFAYVFAGITGDASLLNYVLSQGVKIDSYLRDWASATSFGGCLPGPGSDDGTILHHAVKNFHFRMVKLLLELGANKNVLSNWDNTPLLNLFDYDGRNYPEYDCEPPQQLKRDKATIEKSNQMALLLLNQGINLLAGMPSRSGSGPRDTIDMVQVANDGPKNVIIALQKLFLFAQTEEADILPESFIEKCLQTLEFSFPTKDETLNTPMHVACSQGNLHALRVFLRTMLKHNVLNHPVFSMKNQNQHTPLACISRAVKNNTYAELLVRSYLEVQEEAPADKSSAKGSLPIPLLLAGGDSVPKIQAFEQLPIESFSASVNLEDDLNKILHQSVKDLNVDLVRTVISLKADANYHDNKKARNLGYSPLLSLFMPVLRLLDHDLESIVETLKMEKASPESLWVESNTEVKESDEIKRRIEIAKLLLMAGTNTDHLTLPEWFSRKLRDIYEKRGEDYPYADFNLGKILPSDYREFKSLVKAGKKLKEFANDGNSLYSTATIEHLMKMLCFGFPINQFGESPLHLAFKWSGNVRAIKTFMRVYLYNDRLEDPIWLHRVRGSYFEDEMGTILDLAVQSKENSKAKIYVVMNYLQMFWINPRVAAVMQLFYVKLQSPGLEKTEKVLELQEKWVKATLLSIMDYMCPPLAHTPQGKNLLAQACVKAIMSKTLHKIIQEKLTSKSSFKSQDTSDALGRPLLEYPSLDYLVERAWISSCLLKYGNKGLEILEAGLTGDLRAKFVSVKEKLASPGDGKTGKEHHEIARQKALTLIYDKLHSKLDAPLANQNLKKFSLDKFEELTKEKLSEVCSEL